MSMHACCEKTENIGVLKEYDPRPQNKDGSIRWYLFRWDDGKDGRRKLVKCRICGALFLVQAYHLNRFSQYRETEFEDWYGVESEQQADFLNRTYTGIALEHAAEPVRRTGKTLTEAER